MNTRYGWQPQPQPQPKPQPQPQPQSQLDVVERLSKAILITIPLAVCVAAVHQWAYWSNFGINVFEYLTPSDLAARSAIPLVGTSLSLVLSFVFVVFLERFEKKINSKSRFGGKAYSVFSKIILGLFAFISTIYFIYGDAYRWSVIPLAASALVSIYLCKALGKEYFKEYADIKLFFIVLMPFLVSSSYGEGLASSEVIKTNLRYQYVVDGVDVDGLSDESVRFIGRVGGNIFLYLSNDEGVMIVKSADLERYTLKLYDAYKDKDKDDQ